MLFYIAQAWVGQLGALNVLTYHTVRAAGAAVTGFLVSLIIGPPVIAWLRRVKIGQFIRQEHVADLHKLHEGKAGTPTMGGALIIMATLITLFLWGRWTNPLLIVAVVVFCALGGVGFLDDYTKLRRKHNKGLSAKAKFTGQILTGIGLGVFLYFFPIAESRAAVTTDDILDWPAFIGEVVPPAQDAAIFHGAPIWNRLNADRQSELRELEPAAMPSGDVQWALITAVNEAVIDGAWTEGDAGVGPERTDELAAASRVALEAHFPGLVASRIPELHTKVEVPGFKRVFIPLGLGYILFVLIIIVASSNAVNLTDGLDGLAIGASIISLVAYTAIAYVVSRADWSEYLFLVYVPDARELTVFGAALLGTGLGFMWFNCHPAEVFMGDTGSLALGGALGTMAILTKQELLLILVGGLFVVEAGSVIIQVLSFKTRGKRVFKMSPLHHHFELLGWSESKVTIRFWILALLFALMSLSTLKLR